MRSEFRGGTISLTVPDVFPIEGQGRLVIDPVIRTDAPISDLVGALQPDVAFEKDIGNEGVYVVVYETGFSASDRDLYAIEVRADDFAIVNFGAVEISSDDTRAPAVAAMDAIDRFLIVYEVEVGGTDSVRIESRVRRAGSSDMGLVNHISDELPNSRNTQPDVGGENGLHALYWCVVWRNVGDETAEIRARVVSTTGAPVGFSRSLSAPGSTNESAPVISEGSSAPYGDGRFAFAYTQEQQSTVYTGELRPTPFGIQIVQPAYRLGELGSFSRASISNVAPVLSNGGDPIYAVAVEADGGTQEDQIITFLCAGGGIQSLNNITRLEDIRPRNSAYIPKVAWTGDGFVIAYKSDDRMYMTSASIADVGTRKQLVLGERAQRVQYLGSTDRVENPNLASRAESGDTQSRRALVAYWSIPPNPDRMTVHIGEIERLEERAVGRQYCSAMQNSSGHTAWLAMFGDQGTTSTKSAVASSLPSSQFVLLLNSLQDGFTSQPGGSSGNLCLGGAIGRMGSVIAPIGADRTATIPVDPTRLETPNGFRATQPGETWHFQGWYRDTVGGTVTSNFTNAVEVELN